jgi:hypothetical protein
LALLQLTNGLIKKVNNMNKFLNVFVRVALVWTVFALSFQVTMLTLSYTKPELATKIGNELTWKLDGRFK